MSIEAMKQALEVMGLIGADSICEAAHHQKKNRHEFGEPCPIQQRWHKAFDTLRAAIEQAEKPVCDKDPRGCWNVRCQLGKVCVNTPPRQWVGLTNKDIIEMWPETSTVGWDDIRLIEAKLKEKNT
jgi:hypothetical protein